ncbi:serine aminopeptidase domain-containing protein [Rhizobium sp. SAFR-030]|uniref:serine aminopeptidase domain-containing protein n=1 Tax=Rhizobium sp. SAFR-030 TaxID=3387277 RepID=UPI003F7DBF51
MRFASRRNPHQQDGMVSARPLGPSGRLDAAPAADFQPSAAKPVVFGGTVGLYTPPARIIAPSATAVLFASPWGLEELSTRKFFRVLADRFALHGVASLRFDYPGTGDALDPAEEETAIGAWHEALLDAARLLGSFGHQRVLLIGQSLGAALSLQVSHRMDNLDGVALLAPVVSGRAYLRELALWSTVVDDSLKLRDVDRAPAGSVAIAGLVMPAGIASAVGKLKLSTAAPARPVDYLLLDRPGQIGGDALFEHLQAEARYIERRTFDGYEALIASPTTSRIPQEVIATLVDWVDRHKAPAMAPLAAVASAFNPPAKALLQSPDFSERPVRFGDADRLYGVLCEPVGERRGATVILLGSAYDRHSGWGRLTALTARRLAAAGIASLRFDCANVADSPAATGAPLQVLYSREQQADVTEALDFLETRSLLPAVAVGRCSGAYLAFRSALAEKRIEGVVAVNPYAFHWDETKPLQDDLRSMPQSIDTYWRKMVSGAAIGRILRGEIDIRNSARNVAAAVFGKLEYQMSSRFGLSLTRSAERASVYEAFETLGERRVQVSLLYSCGDVGLDHLRYHFGDDGIQLNRFANVAIEFIPDADHNLTPQAARAVYLERVREMALRIRTRVQ